MFRPRTRTRRQPPETGMAKHAIRSIINNRLLISEHDWAVSIVRTKRSNHAFLVIEGKKDNQYDVFRADLFVDVDNKPFRQETTPITSTINYLWGSSQSIGGRGFVRLKEINVEELESLTQTSEFQGWGINPAQAEALLKKIIDETEKPHTYHVAGNHSSWSSSTSRSNNQNCVAWCLDILKETLGFDVSGSWSNFVQDPRDVLRRIKAQEQTSGTSTHKTPAPR